MIKINLIYPILDYFIPPASPKMQRKSAIWVVQLGQDNAIKHTFYQYLIYHKHCGLHDVE